MRKKIVTAGLAVIAVIALAGFGVWYFLDSQKDAAEPEESITVAYSPFESCALFLIAVDQHFFEENGLNLTLYKSNSGAAALDDMLNGKADLAASVDKFPLVRKVFQGTPAYAAASTDRADYIYIVVREDRGYRGTRQPQREKGWDGYGIHRRILPREVPHPPRPGDSGRPVCEWA